MKVGKKTRLKYRKLVELLRGKSKLLIVLQDNPDPDALGAAAALRKIGNISDDIKCTFVYGGVIGRGQNRALVRYLNLALRKTEEVEFEKFDLIAMVDAQPGTGNNCLPDLIIPDIVIDHHPVRKKTRAATFTDIRRNYGSTSTIMCEYFIEAKIEPEVPLATALLYGIRSDTQDLGREAIQADIDAIERLYPIANKRMLSQIQRGSEPREYFKMLGAGLMNSRVYGNSVIATLGEISNPDMIGEIADLLLREENTIWTMCMGVFEGKLLVSVRTEADNISAETVIKKIVSRRGTGGGHLTYAGGQLRLRKDTKKERAKLEVLVRDRFLRATGNDNEKFGKLL
ncbi:MAG: DHH family phosphoesterase [Planctomycetota bacterium]|jgi:nanoRNase/pAp phosphatase (c-di-AMP/oligoRNAs hydrolase)